MIFNLSAESRTKYVVEQRQSWTLTTTPLQHLTSPSLTFIMSLLPDKIVIITGASTGIGRAIALGQSQPMSFPTAADILNLFSSHVTCKPHRGSETRRTYRPPLPRPTGVGRCSAGGQAGRTARQENRPRTRRYFITRDRPQGA